MLHPPPSTVPPRHAEPTVVRVPGPWMTIGSNAELGWTGGVRTGSGHPHRAGTYTVWCRRATQRADWGCDRRAGTGLAAGGMCLPGVPR